MNQFRIQTLALALLVASAALCQADETPEPAAPSEAPKERLFKLAKDHEVWIDPQRKLVVVDGEVAMREGALEMFACPKGSKEHESVIAVRSNAQLVHAGLLAVGAIAGHPVRFDPEYAPAQGTTVDILVLWQDDKGKHKVRAQEWVKDAKTGEEMKQDWVFGGSGFWTDQTTGEKYYHADGGDFICLSNFSTAMLDLPIESSQANDALLYSAFTERIPPRGTKLRLVLIPRLDKKPKDGAKQDAPAEGASSEKTLKDQQAEVQE
ncbi:MAG: YdjY domain-containing protein [Planctomycetota bacterium]|nr:YdjY domain-containing protein [Planctomycetota bacterium]